VFANGKVEKTATPDSTAATEALMLDKAGPTKGKGGDVHEE